MKKFYSVKSKESSPDGASNPNLLDKITRRYSSLGGKFLRKSPGRKGTRDIVSGSYNMKGNQSDDLRPEIGLPILISKIDRTDLDTIDRKDPQSPVSTDSEDVFVDATSSFPNFADIKFSFLPENTSSPNSSFEDSYDLLEQNDGPPSISKFKSQSAHNLHRTELKVFLKRPPSLEAIEDREIESCYAFPKRLCDENDEEEQEQRKSASGSSASITPEDTTKESSAEPAQEMCQSRESLKSKNSYHEGDDDDDDFDFKSVSLQSLNARNVFLSIELNELTRQINESEDFNQEIAYEYVEHREHLKPCERRITLLRNKESNRFININEKKEKIAKKWTGIKHWIGEEKVKIRDVVQRHAALQRVGARAESLESSSSPNSRGTSEQPSEPDSWQESEPNRPLQTSTDTEQNTSGGKKSASLPKGAYQDSFEVKKHTFSFSFRYAALNGVKVTPN